MWRKSKAEPSSAIILAGGESRRMGRAKAWLDFGGRPLLAHLVELLSARFDEIIVVGAPGQELPETSARVVCDETPGKGPVAGLVTGLRVVSNPLAFVTAVDAPLLRLEITDLLRREIGDSDGAVPEWGGRLQPLCTVYRTSPAVRVLQEQLARDELRLMDAVGRMRVRTVPSSLIRPYDPEGVSFLAANTPDEYERILTFNPEPYRAVE